MIKLSKKIPDYVLLTFSMKDSQLPTIIDNSPTGYADGKYRRRERRKEEQKKKSK